MQAEKIVKEQDSSFSGGKSAVGKIVPVKQPFRKQPINLNLPTGKAVIPPQDYDGILTTSSSRIILMNNPRLVDDLASSTGMKLSPEAVLLGIFSDEGKKPFGIILVKDPSSLDYGKESQAGCPGISPRFVSEMRAAIADGKKRAAALKRIHDPSILDPGSVSSKIYSNLANAKGGPVAMPASEFLERAFTYCALLAGADKRAEANANEIQFLNNLIHENFHAAVALRAYPGQLPFDSGNFSLNEKIATLAEMAYGKSPWLKLRDVAKDYYPFEQGTHFDVRRDRQEINAYLNYNRGLISDLMKSSGSKTALDLAGKSESQLRAASFSLLDDYCEKYFSCKVSELVSPKEGQNILEAGERYILMKKDAVHRLPKRP